MIEEILVGIIITLLHKEELCTKTTERVNKNINSLIIK